MKTRAEFAYRASLDSYFFGRTSQTSPHSVQCWSIEKGGIMSRRTAILLVGAAGIGVGLLSTSAFAAPASGTVIGEAASAGAVTQKVIWRGRAVGWRGVGWRAGYRPGWRGRWGWRPGLAAAGLATAATATAFNSGYGNYPYGYYPYGDNYGYSNTGYYGNGYYGPGAYTAQNYNYGYGYQPAAGAAAVAAPTPPATPNYASYNYGYASPSYAGYGYASPSYASYNNANETGYRTYRGRHRQRSAATTAGAAAGAANTGPVQNQRWTRDYCVNAVHERLGISSSDAGKDANRDAVIRCMQRGPMAIG
jgi:hypothetical protein